MDKYRLMFLLCGSAFMAGCATTEPVTGSAALEPSQIISADLNCDGETDQARLIYPQGQPEVRVEVTLGGDLGRSGLRFGLSDPTRQNALCGAVAGLVAVPSDEQALERALGELPRGYQAAEQCADLVLSDGECDSIYLYWDHSRKHLNWWRQ